MTYKLLALDIDGTLLTTGKIITRKTKRILQAAQDKGLIVTLATGRNYWSARRIARRLKLNIPIISDDGGFIANPMDDVVIYEKRMDMEYIPEIIQILNRYGFTYMFHHERQSLVNRKLKLSDLGMELKSPVRKFLFGLHRFVSRLYEKSSTVVVPGENMLSQLIEKGIVPFKMTILTGNYDEAKETAIEEFADKLGKSINISISGPNGFEILPKGISKAMGLHILAGHLGLDQSEIIAMGDSYNDLDMLKYAGFGIAMGNAPEDIRKQAMFVTRSNDEDGVAFAVEKFYLNI